MQYYCQELPRNSGGKNKEPSEMLHSTSMKAIPVEFELVHAGQVQ